VFFNERTLRLGPFLFFGDAPGLPLSLDGFKVAKHAKANSKGVKAERAEIREIPKSKFTKYETVAQIYERLFKTGPMAQISK
jgi:hypothetical protein